MYVKAHDICRCNVLVFKLNLEYFQKWCVDLSCSIRFPWFNCRVELSTLKCRRVRFRRQKTLCWSRTTNVWRTTSIQSAPTSPRLLSCAKLKTKIRWLCVLDDELQVNGEGYTADYNIYLLVPIPWEWKQVKDWPVQGQKLADFLNWNSNASTQVTALVQWNAEIQTSSDFGALSFVPFPDVYLKTERPKTELLVSLA